MANQPESATYDAGVYQLQTTDPVQGGVGGLSNTPLLNLANRTAYLKAHMDAIEGGTFTPPGMAPINSPTFTGDPKAPTPAAGDNDTSLATTAFVVNLGSGIQSVSVAGNSNVTLTATQYGAGIVKLTGGLTGNINVIFPVNGAWTVINSTTGAWTITCKTAGGTGVLVAQNKTLPIEGDGTNIIPDRTDFNSLASVSIATSGTFTGADAATWTSAGILNLTHLGIGGTAGAYTLNVTGTANVSGAFTCASVVTTGGIGIGLNLAVGTNVSGPGYTLTADGGSGANLTITGFANSSIYSWNGATATANWQLVCGGSGGVILNNGSTSWAAISDYRAKDVSGDFTKSGDIIDAVPVYLAAMKSKPQVQKAMFLAHELQLAVPYAVYGEKDAVDDNEEPVFQTIESSDPLVAILWAEIRSMRSRLAALEGAGSAK